MLMPGGDSACARCYKRKIKCNRKFPCLNCTEAGALCEPRVSKRLIIESLEAKIHQLEVANSQYKIQLQQREDELSAREQELSRHEEELTIRERTLQSRSSSVRNTTHDEDNIDGDDKVITVTRDLSLAAVGENRYLGSSSGVLFARIVSSTVASAAKKSLESNTSGTHGFAMTTNVPNSLFFNMYLDQRQLMEDPETTDVPISKQIADQLVSVYFNHTHVAYPFLDQEEFTLLYDKIYECPGYYSKDVYASFIFDMVLAIATSSIDKNQFSAYATRRPFHLMALGKLSSVLCLERLKCLTAILLLSVYSLMHDSSVGVWQLVGIAIRYCTELGLHWESSSVAKVGIAAEGFLCIERRRRLFWSTFALDRIVSVTTGRPLGFQDNDISVTLPSSHSDSCIWMHHRIAMSRVSGSPSSSVAEPIENCMCPAKSSFVHILELRYLTGKISGLLYSKSIQSSYNYKYAQLKERLDRKLTLWREQTISLQLDDQECNRSCFVDKTWFELLYQNAMQILHRPSLAFPVSTNEDILKLLESSAASLKCYHELCRKRRLNYSCLTLHSVFMAGISYLYSIAKLLCDLDNDSLNIELPEHLAVFEVTRACSNVLTSIAERWNQSQESQVLFDKLSSVVLQEYVERRVRISAGLKETLSFNDRFEELRSVFEENSYLNQVPIGSALTNFDDEFDLVNLW